MLESNAIHVSDEAAAYDAMISRHGWLLNRPFIDLVSGCGLERARVLDLGTGPGHVPIALARRHSGWEIWAVDASADMLERGRGYAREAGVGDRIHFLQADVTDLPFPAGEFDLVVSNFTLHHIDHPEAFFDEAARMMRDGGKVILKDLLRPSAWKARLLLTFSKHVLRYTDLQLRLYRESLAAALTLEEVRAALRRSRLATQVRRMRRVDFVVAV